ncbi:MAG: type I glyceraldehyde-3-phosphate dehydrogenase [Chitinophagaceae bacterium]|nr:type I glyceraldehyde-3-phosphate dehydrogenase [Chitinophagaceae bacterium]
MRIAINGMGRIGRLLFRRLVGEKDITLVAINDIMDSSNLAYLLKYDSLYGTWPEEIRYEEGSVHTCGQEVKVFRQTDPLLLDWAGMEVDIVLECSGRFSDLSGAQKHIKAGAQRVLLSTTGSSDIPLLIFGHNHKEDSRLQPIISPGGCMTNCSTHILYLLNSIGIESVQMNILHSYTSRQELVDTAHPQFRRGRAAAESIIPVEIDLAHSLERLLPLKDKIAAVSVRVPVTNGAMADITVQMKEEVTKAQINHLLRRAAEGEYKGIIQYTEDPLVSADIKGNTHSCIIDGSLTSVIGKQVKIIAWFDNEYGFTSRMIDWVRYLSSNNQHQ